jgi:hypothetical protein
MTHDSEQPMPPTAEPRPRSTATERMRLHRQRLREGRRCLVIELLGGEIDVLIRRGLLEPDERTDPDSLRVALYEFLDQTFGVTP